MNEAQRVERLTDREREVLVLVGECRSYGHIARALGISVATVRSHVDRMRRKLGIQGGRPKERLIRFYERHQALFGGDTAA